MDFLSTPMYSRFRVNRNLFFFSFRNVTYYYVRLDLKATIFLHKVLEKSVRNADECPVQEGIY